MTDLKDCRNRIDSIDAEIAALLEKRLDVVRAVADCKAERGLPVRDADREKEKLQALESLCSDSAWPYAAGVFAEIMAQSRRLQQDLRGSGTSGQDAAPAYGLLGRNLRHSYSPRIHRIIGGYEFGLIDRAPGQLDGFFRDGAFRGITVTMPYKKTVMKYCSELSETAKKCGSVNTIVKRRDGTYYGDNTDYHGFRSTVISSGVSVAGAKALVFGSGGVSGTAVQVLQDLGAASVTVISRTGPDNYENLDRHCDARILVNATPVGMYPNAGEAVVDIRKFPACAAVFDLVYNPLRTKFMLDAADAGIPAFGGLHMLTAQAAKAYELFCGENRELPVDQIRDLDALTHRACDQLRWEQENVVLIGMPGSGKTTIGRRLAEITGKPFVDCDAKIAELHGRTPEEIISRDGEERFREIESAVIRQVLRKDAMRASGIIFATGGGCVEREENRVPLRENSLVVWLQRELSKLPAEGRPLTQKEGVGTLFERRREQYERWSDVCCKL